MKRPLAYITAHWGDNEFENTENAAKYCRLVYEAGFSPICPLLFLPLFLKDSIPQEHKDGIDMARDYLRRASVLVVCGGTVDEAMKNDIAVAERLRITATTLDGILTVKGQGREDGDAMKFVKENDMVKMVSYKGNIFSVEPPMFVELEITETEPGVKGDTATNVTKPATVETGAQVNVPIFVNQGDKIQIDTRTGEYLKRI